MNGWFCLIFCLKSHIYSYDKWRFWKTFKYCSDPHFLTYFDARCLISYNNNADDNLKTILVLLFLIYVPVLHSIPNIISVAIVGIDSSSRKYFWMFYILCINFFQKLRRKTDGYQLMLKYRITYNNCCGNY